MRNRLVLFVALLLPGFPAFADQYHYNNIIVGDRAIGLGGAYTAIADDASGVVYNPAGLGFALANDISGSANAFYKKKTVYKNALGSEDFTEESGGSMAPFFGGLQKLDNVMPGLVFAFGIASVDSDLKDQNDLISNTAFTSSGKNAAGEIVYTDGFIDRLHRAVTVRASTSSAGAAVAKRIGGGFSVGFGINYVTIEELVQEYQDNQVDPPDSATVPSTQRTQIVQNIRQLLSAAAMEPSLGIQWAIANSLSFGFVIKYPVSVTQTFKSSTERYSYSYAWSCYFVDGGVAQFGSDGKKCPDAIADGDVPSTATSASTVQKTTAISRGEADQKVEKPIGDFPPEARMGFAWFASPRLLMALDFIHRAAAKKGDYVLLEREAVTNIAFGTEYYMTPSLPLRFGLFTNNDARPEVKSGERDQPDHIDYLGTSIFLAWVQPNSQVALGVVYQDGKGKAQKAGGYLTQDVIAYSATAAFSATHNF